MVLGLINFLLGGKKKTKISRTGQVATPMGRIGGANQNQPSNTIPDGQSNPTQNSSDANEMNFKDMTGTNNVGESSSMQPQSDISQDSKEQVFGNGLRKKSISEVIGKIHEELKSTNDKIGGMVSDIKNIENNVNTLGHRIDDLEESKKGMEEKFNDINGNMGKFLSLYELINNQYNPFVDNSKTEEVKKVEILSDGNTVSQISENSNTEPQSFDELNLKPAFNNSTVSLSEDDLNSSLLELDTLDIEEAAGDAVPLTKLKNNTNSLVVILSWLEYLIKRVGIDETRNSLRYYTETLRWITPEVFFDLDKYLRGMKDKKEIDSEARLNVKDHIVSLYFISKLNEKTLDSRLTKAVLQIIKQ